MKDKINVAELLKDCPKGMELDCTMFDNVYLEQVDKNVEYPIVIRMGKTDYKRLTKEGCWNKYSNAKCVIFPKGKTTWEGFQRPFKDGDIIFTHANCLKVGLGNTWISIFQEKRNGGVATYVDYAEDGGDFYSYNEDKGLLCMDEDIMRQRFATEKEKERLFQAIKDNGYKWNEETKTLEELPKFKVGDRIRHKNDKTIIKTIGYVYHNSYALYDGHLLLFTDQDMWELAPNKFDINTLKPFDKVLVRNHEKSEWQPNFFNKYCKKIKKFKLIGICTPACGNTEHFVDYCIPYEGNEHLLGTTNDCEKHFKTWK